MVDLERRLRDYGAELDSALPPVTTAEIYRHSEGLDIEVLPPPRPRWTPLRVALVAAGIALLLFLPVLLLRDSTEPPVVDDPVTTTVPATSTSVPATTTPSASGQPAFFVSETSLGNIEWTRVESDRRIDPIGSVDGMILGGDSDGYLQSSDGITWEPAEEPEISPWSYVPVGDERLAAVSPCSFGGGFGGSSRRVIYRSGCEDPEAEAVLFRQEGSEWAQIPLPATQPGPIPGLEVLGPVFQGVAGRDGSNWVAPMLYLVRVPWSDAYGTFPYTEPYPGADTSTSGPWPIWNEDLQVLEVFRPGGDVLPPRSAEPLASMNVEVAAGDPPTIEFRDAETGDLVHTVEATMPGWTPEQLLAGIRGWGLFDVSFVVSNEGELSVVRPPWSMGEDWGENEIIESSGRYYTPSLVLGGENYSATEIHLWESEDGLTWNAVDLPQLHDIPIDYVILAGGGGRMFLSVEELGGTGAMWTSTDAREWHLVAGGLAWFPESTDFGWLSNNFDSVGISADGENWERLDLPGALAEPTFRYLDGIFFLGPTGDSAPFVTWVGRFLD